MQKFEYRAVIKFLTKKGLSAVNFHQELISVYGEDCCSRSTVERWSREFRRGRETLEDDERSGRPSTSTTGQVVEATERLVMNDRRIIIEEIAASVDISSGSAHTILHDHLHMNKCISKSVPPSSDATNAKRSRGLCSRSSEQLGQSRRWLSQSSGDWR